MYFGTVAMWYPQAKRQQQMSATGILWKYGTGGNTGHASAELALLGTLNVNANLRKKCDDL